MAVTIAPRFTLKVGATRAVSALAKDPAGTTIPGQSVGWSSSNTAVATVAPASGSATVVTAVSAGSAVITGTVAASPPSIPAPITAQVTVDVASIVASLELVPA